MRCAHICKLIILFLNTFIGPYGIIRLMQYERLPRKTYSQSSYTFIDYWLGGMVDAIDLGSISSEYRFKSDSQYVKGI
jgi:hypothetical protein